HHHLTIEVLAIPGQMTTGKESSNPFTAGSLPKTILYSFLHKYVFIDSPLLRVNTSRSDEDRLELVELMVFVMKKDVCDEFELNAARLSKFLPSGKYAAQGFEQIIDFLSGSYIHHALTVNPHVYISCIKQFWNTAVVKRSGDVTRLQALVDKKRIVITEEVIREILQLNDAEGVICLPNNEIFDGLARMGYEKPSTKLTFYKAFFSTQWKFFIHTILHSLSAKRTSWNEFSSAMASALICLSSSQRFKFSKYIFESLVCNVDSTSKFYMYHRFIQLIIQSNIADLSKHTNRYISPVLTQKVFANMRRVGKGFSGVETSFFENMLTVRAIDAEEEVQVPAQDDVVQEHVIEEIATEVVPPTPTSPLPLSPVIPSTPPHQSPSPPQPQAAEGLKKNSKRTKSKQNGTKTGSKPQFESEARKNMISYLKNTEGYKMEFFKGKTYDQILPIFQARFDANMKFLFKTREEMEKEDEEIIKSINEIPTQKAAKRRKLSEEAQEADDLKGRLEIVQDKDDYVFVEAIPLAQKVPVVDYQVVVIDNKPRYKIIRADDTHQFYISFTTLLKNFDREDLETLWRIVKDRFSTKKPTNFSDEYLLLTLKIMFGELDEQDAIWRNQRSVYGLALVKRWKLLTSCGVHVIILSTV
nr:hypothetical protein [Tanacetum cinerariifolium]